MKATISLLSLIIAAMLLCCGCSKKEQYRIGVSQCSYDDWREKLNDEINRELLTHNEATADIVSAYDNIGKQIDDIQRFIDEDYDIIIASPIEAEALTPIIKEAAEKGIPTIIFDRNINEKCYTAYLGADNALLGKNVGDYLAARMSGEGKIIEIKGLLGSTPAVERHEGFMKSLEKHPGLSLIATADGDWTSERASVLADSLLKIYPDADAIFAQNDRMAIAAREAADRLGIKDITIVGIDAVANVGIKAVADGVIDATFLYPTGGKELIETALKILKNKPYQDNIILSSAMPVDSTNAEILQLLSGSLQNEADKVTFLKDRVDEYTNKHIEQTMLLYAIIAVLILSAGIIFMLLRVFWIRKRHQRLLSRQNEQLTQQRDELVSLNHQLKEATQAKLVFFTNVSHDLRTPLTLIAEPISQLKDASNLTPEQKVYMKLADKNVKILMRLINQILDFRKYENGKLKLDLTEVNICDSILEWSDAFKPLALKNHVHFNVELNLPHDTHMAIDTEKMERIFFNLMSNAFKNTPSNGKITATATIVDENLVMTISDTGKGMSEKDISRIFERFYQADKVRPGGSGIGLALAKAFTNLHNGDITVKSALGEGTVFTVTVPIMHISENVMTCDPIISGDAVTEELGEVNDDAPVTEEGKPYVLVIDDTTDIRTLVKNLLGTEYTVIEASNGKQGIKLASKYIPDLIICDVMMPGMNGMECCSLLKKETTTSHIPILMLTACSLDEQRIEGYENGADGYLAKPFNSQVLAARCKSLIDNRKRITSLTRSDNKVNKPAKSSAQPKAMDIDNEFYTRFEEIVESEISNSELSIEEIGSRLGLSRVQFYRKIKALTNYSPNELLRIIRLKKAYQLLTSTESTVAEVGYKVGFASPSYFSKCFKEYYGELPAEVQNRTSKISYK